MGDFGAAALSKWFGLDRRPDKLSMAVLALQCLFLLVICVDLMGLSASSFLLGRDIEIAQFLVSFFYLTLAPGVLFISLLGLNVNRLESLVYAVLSSTLLVMLLGAGLSILYQRAPLLLPAPMTESVFPFAVSTLVLVLLAGYHASNNSATLPSRTEFKKLQTPLSVGALFISLSAIVGAHFINIFSSNWLILCSILIISLLPLIVILTNSGESVRTFVLWLMSIGLLMQNSVITTYLARGDAQNEYYIANLVLTHGVWNPTFADLKNGLLRVAILHPAYTIATDLDLMWEFKIIHPLLFSIISIALYRIYSRQISADGAFLSVTLFIFLHPFFTLLSRNTRTAFALLFFTGILLSIMDPEIDRRHRSIFTILFGHGVVFSHYGTAPVILIFLFVSAPILYVYNNRGYKIEKIGVIPTLVTGIGTYIWYLYTTDGHLFDAISSIFVHGVIATLTKFGEILMGAQAATSKTSHSSGGLLDSIARQILAINYPSVTYSFIKVEYAIITALGALAVWSLLTLYLYSDIKRVDKCVAPFEGLGSGIPNREFVIFGSVMTLFIVSTFTPAAAFGISRIYMIIAIVLSPFIIVALNVLLQFWSTDWGVLVSVLLMIMLIIHSGWAATVLLEERSPQPNIDRERISTSGSNWQVYHLFKRTFTKQEYSSSQWMASYLTDSRSISGSGVRRPLGIFFYTKYSDSPYKIEYFSFGNNWVKMSSPVSSGYVYIDELTHRLGVNFITNKSSRYPTLVQIPLRELQVESENKIYDSGNTTVYVAT